MADDDHDDPPASSRRAAVGLVLFLLGMVAVLFIIQQLRHAGQLQDCIASGRTNCAPIEGTTSR
jgi:hypothetical protein